MPSATNTSTDKPSIPVEGYHYPDETVEVKREITYGDSVILDPADFPVQDKQASSHPELNAAKLSLSGLFDIEIAQVPTNLSDPPRWAIITKSDEVNNPKISIGSGLFFLKPGKPLNIGRGMHLGHGLHVSENEFISRNHAQLTVSEDGRLTVGSTVSNGTSLTRRFKDQESADRVKAVEDKHEKKSEKHNSRVRKAIGACAFAAVAGLLSNALYNASIDDSDTEQNTTSIVSVEEGDTLSEIADRYLVSLDELMAANPDISAEGVITPGQYINIPDIDMAVAQEAHQELLEQLTEDEARDRAEKLKEQRQYLIETIDWNQEGQVDRLDFSRPASRWELVISTHINDSKREWVQGYQLTPGASYSDIPSEAAFDQNLNGIDTPNGYVDGLEFMGSAGGELPVYIPQNEAFQCSNSVDIASNINNLMVKLPADFLRLADAKLVVFGIDEKGDNVGGYWNESKGLVMADCAEAEISAEWLSTLMVHEFGHGVDTALNLSDKVYIDLHQASGGTTFNGESIPIGYIRTAFAHKETDKIVENADLEKYEGTLPERFYTPGPDQIFPSRYGASSKAEHIAETIEDLMSGGLIGENSESYGSPYHRWQNDLINAIETSENGWPGFRLYLERIRDTGGF